MDKIVDTIEPSKFKAYKDFTRAVILEGISVHNLTFDHLNHQLYILNKKIYEGLCQTAIEYFEIHASAEIKSIGN